MGGDVTVYANTGEVIAEIDLPAGVSKVEAAAYLVGVHLFRLWQGSYEIKAACRIEIGDDVLYPLDGNMTARDVVKLLKSGRVTWGLRADSDRQGGG